MLKITLFSVLLFATTGLWSQAKKPSTSPTGFVAKNEKQQNKIPIKCKADSTCVDETGVSLTGVNKAKAGTTKQ